MKPSVTLFIPTLNEIDGMRRVMPRVKREWVDQVLIVDGQSSDGTAEYARKQGYDVCVQKEKGLRKAYNEAWPLIRGDIVITFSPDGNCIPELIPPLIGKMKVGSGSRRPDYPRIVVLALTLIGISGCNLFIIPL